MRIRLGLIASIFFSLSGFCLAAPYEPPRGSHLRAELLNAFRPLAAFDLGAPIEFRVLELSVDGDVAFARLMAQRPGGAEIDMAATPMVQWRHVDPFEVDGPRFEVFFVQEHGHWQAVEYGLGSSDVWWWGYRCDVFGSLLQRYGC